MPRSYSVIIACVILLIIFTSLGCEPAPSPVPNPTPVVLASPIYAPATPTATLTASQTPTRDLTASPSPSATATTSPSATPTRCRGFMWAHGTVSPEFISQVQDAMRGAGIEGSVEAGTFGETNPCGTYGARDLSYGFTVQVENLQDGYVLNSTARGILGIAQASVKISPANSLDRVQLIFQVGGQRCAWSYQNGLWHLYTGDGFIECPGPFSSEVP